MLKFLTWLINLLIGKKKQPVSQQTDNQKEFYGNPPQDVDKSEWTCIAIDPNGIKVAYQEKYGMLRTESCLGLWENDTQYRLTWKDSKFILLEKSNVVSIQSAKE